MPVPAFNVINGGSHAGNNLPMQEFMILPVVQVHLLRLFVWAVKVSFCFHYFFSKFSYVGI